MKRDLKKLKRTNNSAKEFADFLKNEDGKLIDYGLNCIENEVGNQDEEDILPAKKIKLSDEKINITQENISSWIALLKENFPEGLKELSSGLRASVCFSTSTVDKYPKYEVSNAEVHKSIISVCNDMVPILKKYLSLQGQKSKSSSPSGSHKWKNIQLIMEEYLESALKMLEEKEMSILVLGLTHLIEMSQFYSCFPKFVPTYVEKLVELWSGSYEELKKLSQKCLSSLLLSANESVAKFMFRKLYLSFMQSCTNLTASTIEDVTTKRNYLAELLASKPKSAYIFVATYLEQMRMSVDSITVKKDFAKVCNWQSIQSLSLWCEVIGKSKNDDKIKELRTPFCNVVLKIVGLNTSPMYAPLRMLCVRLLMNLSKETGLFIPSLLSIIIEPLGWRLFEDKPEQTDLKSFLYSTRIQVDKSEIQEKAFVDETVNEVMDLLLCYTITYSHTVSFPGLVHEVSKKFKNFKEACVIPAYVKKLEQVTSKIKSVSDKMEKKRRADALELKNKTEMNKWESDSKDEKNELKKYYDNWSKERSKQLEQALMDEKAQLEEVTEKSNSKSSQPIVDSDSEEDMDIDEDNDESSDDDDDGSNKKQGGELFYEDDEEPLEFEDV